MAELAFVRRFRKAFLLDDKSAKKQLKWIDHRHRDLESGYVRQVQRSVHIALDIVCHDRPELSRSFVVTVFLTDHIGLLIERCKLEQSLQSYMFTVIAGDDVPSEEKCLYDCGIRDGYTVIVLASPPAVNPSTRPRRPEPQRMAAASATKLLLKRKGLLEQAIAFKDRCEVLKLCDEMYHRLCQFWDVHIVAEYSDHRVEKLNIKALPRHTLVDLSKTVEKRLGIPANRQTWFLEDRVTKSPPDLPLDKLVDHDCFRIRLFLAILSEEEAADKSNSSTTKRKLPVKRKFPSDDSSAADPRSSSAGPNPKVAKNAIGDQQPGCSSSGEEDRETLWTCETCTLRNSFTSECCEACNVGQRPPQDGLTSALSSSSGISSCVPGPSSSTAGPSTQEHQGSSTSASDQYTCDTCDAGGDSGKGITLITCRHHVCWKCLEDSTHVALSQFRKDVLSGKGLYRSPPVKCPTCLSGLAVDDFKVALGRTRVYKLGKELKKKEDSSVSVENRFCCQNCSQSDYLGRGITLKAACNHKVCRKCVGESIRKKTQHIRQFTANSLKSDDYGLTCPICPTPLHDDDIASAGDDIAASLTDLIFEFKRVLHENKALLEFKKTLNGREAAAQSSSVSFDDKIYCQRSDCSGWLPVSTRESSHFVCPKCGSNNCVKCSSVHHPQTCAEYQQALNAAAATVTADVSAEKNSKASGDSQSQDDVSQGCRSKSDGDKTDGLSTDPSDAHSGQAASASADATSVQDSVASNSGASNSGASGSGASGSGASTSGASGSGASTSGASTSGASGSGTSYSGASSSGASGSGTSNSGASSSGSGSAGSVSRKRSSGQAGFTSSHPSIFKTRDILKSAVETFHLNDAAATGDHLLRGACMFGAACKAPSTLFGPSSSIASAVPVQPGASGRVQPGASGRVQREASDRVQPEASGRVQTSTDSVAASSSATDSAGSSLAVDSVAGSSCATDPVVSSRDTQTAASDTVVVKVEPIETPIMPANPHRKILLTLDRNPENPLSHQFVFASGIFHSLVNTGVTGRTRKNFVIDKIYLHENALLRAKFDAELAGMRQKYPDREENHQVLAFHGTSRHNVDDIFENNFDADRVKRGKYGYGVYFSEYPDLALLYSEKTNPVLILSKVIPGQSHEGDCGRLRANQTAPSDLQLQRAKARLIEQTTRSLTEYKYEMEAYQLRVLQYMKDLENYQRKRLEDPTRKLCPPPAHPGSPPVMKMASSEIELEKSAECTCDSHRVGTQQDGRGSVLVVFEPDRILPLFEYHLR